MKNPSRRRGKSENRKSSKLKLRDQAVFTRSKTGASDGRKLMVTD
jgi:hypothetical protein